MLSKEDNQLVTNTDRSTPTGELFRRFWLPVALAEEIAERDGPPVHVKVLGEDLVAFRDTNGRIGLLDAFCPHRGAPLFFGRNEDCGLRCVYHGWMFDADGACVDLPNAPEGETFRQKIHITSYPCVEAGDLIWAYLGPAEKQPPFPEFEWLHLPSSHRYVKKFRLECNYLQAMEGDYDPSHARFLHSTLADANIPNPLNQNGTMARNPALAPGELSAGERFPRIVGDRRVTKPLNAELEDTDSGVIAVSASELPDGRVQASVAVTWMMPIFCTAGIAGPNTYSSNMRIPIDNKSLMFYRLRWSYSPIPEAELEEYRTGGYYYPELIPGTFTPRDNLTNNYNIDRTAQKERTYSGIRTFPLQDIAMMENQWGPIADRTKEHLTSSDEQIIHVRRRLLRAAKMLDDGIEPSEPWHPQAYSYHRETAVGETREEAIAKAKAKAMASLLPSHGQVTEPAAAPGD